MKNIGRTIIIVLVALLVGYILWYFKNIVAYILISLVLSLIGKPVVDFLGKFHYKQLYIPKGLRALLALLLIWLVVISFFKIFIPLVISQANELSNINPNDIMRNLQEPIDRLAFLIEKYSLNDTQADLEGISIEQRIQNYLMSLMNLSLVSNIFGSLAGILGNVFIAMFSISFITFFFLKDSNLFSNTILLLVPTKHEEAIKRALASIRRLLMRYFLGIALQVTGIIILVTIGLTIVGIEFKQGLVIGLVAGLLNIIPYLGPVMGSIIGIILGLATHLHLPFYSELLPLIGYMIIVFVAVQITDNILFQPIIYSSSVNAHPLEIFLVIMIAGTLAGIAGMVLAVPAYTVLRVFSREFFNNLKVVKKMTENIS